MSSNLPEEYRVNPIKDTSNPRSIINLTPSSVSNAIGYIPESIFELGERELKQAAKPTEIEERLRYSFWREYDQAQSALRRINLANIYGGVCSQTHFLKNIVSNSFKLAYILTPPLDYEVQMQELLGLGLEQLRDILLQPHVDDNGKPNPKMADVKQKIVESLHLRVKGAVPYRMETKNLNVNVDGSKQGQLSSKSNISISEIDRELQELEARVNGDVIDVTVVDSEES